MPPKIRQLKAALKKAGFSQEAGKGSHTVWRHPDISGIAVTLSGKDGHDAEHYQIKDVQNALKKVGENL